MMRIGRRKIGNGQKCFIIGEAGVNHNGNVGMAKRMIDAAAYAKVDAVKFQTFKTEELVTKNVSMAPYQKKNIGKEGSQFDMLKKLELDYEDFKELKDYAENKKLIFLSTPFDVPSVELLRKIGVSAFKIASGELTNTLLLDAVGKARRPVILSTGMATLNEIREAINALKKAGSRQIILLHCVTNYPAPANEANLRAMETLQNTFHLPVGYSDHTIGLPVALAAVVKGACVIEKHFTLDKTMEGPDHKASLDPEELCLLVKGIREIELAEGTGDKNPTSSERRIKKFMRKSIVANIDIAKGKNIHVGDITVKRPEGGIEPKYFYKLVGKKAKRAIKKDEQIRWGDVRGG